MRKVATIIVVVFLLSVVFMTSPVSGREYALEVGGFTAKSHDGNARLFNQETGMYNGNITTIELNDIETEDGMADDAWNDGTQGSIEPSEYDIYGWPSDAAGGNEKEPYFWESNPEEAGENVLFLAEYQFWTKKLKLR